MHLKKKHYIIFKLEFGMKFKFRFGIAAHEFGSCM